MIDIKEVSFDDLLEFRNFFEKAKYKSYSEFSEIPSTKLGDFCIHELHKMKRRNCDPRMLLAEEKGNVRGFLSFENMNWDTEHFNLPMGRISHLLGGGAADLETKTVLVKKVLELLRKQGTKHVMVRISTNDFAGTRALEKSSFFLVDTHLEYFFDYRRNQVPVIPHECSMRLSEKEDASRIQEIARTSFSDYIDRFHRDPLLANRADDLFVNWAINSCKKGTEEADEVIVATTEKELVGFATLKLHKDVSSVLPFSFGEIVLSGVSPKARGKHVYTSMINFGQHYFNGKVDFLKVASQVDNTSVQRVWVKLGFALVVTQYTFHKHLV